MPLKLSDAELAIVTAVAGRLPLRLRGAFLQELAAAFAGHEEGLRKIAVEAAKRVVKIEAADSRVSVPAARRAERRQLVERLRALQAEARDCPDGATKAAMAQASPPVATITATCRLTRSEANPGSRSYLPSVSRC
jgi:hypothetical protein